MGTGLVIGLGLWLRYALATWVPRKGHNDIRGSNEIRGPIFFTIHSIGIHLGNPLESAHLNLTITLTLTLTSHLRHVLSGVQVERLHY